jgi:hypothetical protein
MQLLQPRRQPAQLNWSQVAYVKLRELLLLMVRALPPLLLQVGSTWVPELVLVLCW